MWSLTFVLVVSVVCSATAITLPNGFTFDESQFINLESRATSPLDQTCEGKYFRCLDDCETALYCDSNYSVINISPCTSWSPYCVKDVGANSQCTGNFPMENPICFNKALNNFMCTADGNFPDPTDCTKYHICKGSSHSIVECPAWHRYASDPYSSIYDSSIVGPYNESGNVDYACHFNHEHMACACVQTVICDGNPNTFTFLGSDRLYYAYCLVIGSIKKVLMFKCPAGTLHNLMLNNVTNSVECLPVQPTVT